MNGDNTTNEKIEEEKQQQKRKILYHCMAHRCITLQGFFLKISSKNHVQKGKGTNDAIFRCEKKNILAMMQSIYLSFLFPIQLRTDQKTVYVSHRDKEVKKKFVSFSLLGFGFRVDIFMRRAEGINDKMKKYISSNDILNLLSFFIQDSLLFSLFFFSRVFE